MCGIGAQRIGRGERSVIGFSFSRISQGVIGFVDAGRIKTAPAIALYRLVGMKNPYQVLVMPFYEIATGIRRYAQNAIVVALGLQHHLLEEEPNTVSALIFLRIQRGRRSANLRV